jgi:putative toxin-antitoxin system antitoxin component (TIGR02293 family)
MEFVMSAAARKTTGKAAMIGAPAVIGSPRRKRVAGISSATPGVTYGRRLNSPTAFAGNPSEIISQMRNGTPAKVIPELASRIGISQDGLFQMLRLPKSTMKARISKNDLLSVSEQDRLYRTEKVLTRALAVLEDDESAKAWVVRGNRSLGGEAPLSLLDTEVGYELVLDTLGRIEYGIVS